MEVHHQTSTLGALLPSAFQLRLPRIQSIRRSISTLSLPTTTKSIELDSNSDFKSRLSPLGVDPSEANYNSLVCRGIIDQDEVDRHYFEKHNIKGGSHWNQLPSDAAKTKEGGILWKFANHGYSLLRLAISESTAPKLTDEPFARQLYIHSLTYLIRALPSDLTTDERTSIRTAIPDDIIDTHEQHSSQFRAEMRPTSFLHRTLASTIVQLFILFQFILPYIRFVLAKAWSYQREHHIIVRMTSHCVELGVGVGEAMKSIGETKMGELIIIALQWLIEGVVGGIGEGMVIINALGRNNVGELVSNRVGRATK